MSLWLTQVSGNSIAISSPCSLLIEYCFSSRRQCTQSQVMGHDACKLIMTILLFSQLPLQLGMDRWASSGQGDLSSSLLEGVGGPCKSFRILGKGDRWHCRAHFFSFPLPPTFREDLPWQATSCIQIHPFHSTLRKCPREVSTFVSIWFWLHP